MRRVKSQAELKRMALLSGAAVEIDGRKFNTTMDKVELAEPEEQADPPAPAVVLNEPTPAAPTPVQETIQIHLDMDPVASAIESGNEKVVQAITDKLRELQVPTSAASPKSWTFTIKRDVRGFIESVNATPQL